MATEMTRPQAGSRTDAHRLPPRSGEVIDRGARVAFTFDGRDYTGYEGDTIASAMAASGVRVFSRSFKYHRPRGLLCCAGQCPNCLVQIGDEPNVRACTRRVETGMAVCSQNAQPSLDRDLLSLTQLAAPLMPVGFYYKTFIRPAALWPSYERVLRRAAGLGKVDLASRPGAFDKEYLHADVAVVGGGPSGMAAAVGAAEQGASVALFDVEPSLGGRLRYSRSRSGGFASLRSSVANRPDVDVYTDTSVLGWYQDNWLAAVKGSRLFKIRAKSVVVATGAIEMPLLFDNNDLPGVMLGSAAQRLAHLYGVKPGERALVLTANDDGWDVAVDLAEAGIDVAAVVDERHSCSSSAAKALISRGVPAYFRHTILEAVGSKRVRAARVARIDPLGEADRSATRNLPCDLVVVSMGWTPDLALFHMAGGKSVYDEQRSEHRATDAPEGMFVAGRAAGAGTAACAMEEGRIAGKSAAAFLGFGDGPTASEVSDLHARKAGEPVRTSGRTIVPGRKKRFLCYCEDVTDVDLQTAIVEGYDSLELLKRYSTISMGPCQGRMCSMNTVRLCARANGTHVQETGKTTSRPPVAPVTLGALAGQNMEPVQVSPVHQWHLDRGAGMMVAGLWLRPEDYGDPVAEVKAVRERVGLMDVSTLGKIQLTGSGVPELLERLYVNQWRKLGVGRVRYGVMCNDEGVVIDDGVCARVQEDEWYMSTTSTGATTVFEWIQWWAQSGWGDGVHAVNLTDSYAAFNLAGPRSREVLQLLTDRDLGNPKFPYMRVRSTRVAGVLCRVLRIGFTGELSYEIHCPASFGMHVWEALMAAGKEFDVAPFGVEAQRVLRLEKAHIIVGQDTDALTDPFSANMEWVVKLNKRDFLGKPMLTRMSERGTAQRLVGFRMARPDLVPEEGLQAVCRDGNGRQEIIGWLTSCRFSPALGETIGLCWLPANVAAEAGTPFQIRRGGELEEAYVHHGPFYDPAGERLQM